MLKLQTTETRPGQLPIPHHLADFRIRNPSFRKARRASFTAWPVSTFADGEQFTLLAINTGLSATGTLAGFTRSNQWTEFLFRIGTNEPAQRTTDPQDRGPWFIESIELWDAFGNFVWGNKLHGRIFPVGHEYVSRRDDGIALIPDAVWPNETWNVRAIFHRQVIPSLDAAYRWTTFAQIPEHGAKISLAQTGRVAGCEIRLESIESSKSIDAAIGRPVVIVTVLRSDPNFHWDVLDVQDSVALMCSGGLAFRPHQSTRSSSARKPERRS